MMYIIMVLALKQVRRIFSSDFEPIDIEIKISILRKPTMIGNTFTAIVTNWSRIICRVVNNDEE